MPEIDLPADLNTARRAAMVLATQPPITDARARVEIALHVALYRAAYHQHVGDFTEHFLLVPAAPFAGLPEPPPLAITDRSFRLRVLGALADLGVRIAYAPRDGLSSPDHFPGTRSRATQLRFHILHRDPLEATVSAQVTDETPNAGSSRRRLTAVWDGATWIVAREGARLVW